MADIARIVVIGSANTDLTFLSNRFPKGGETLFGQDFDLGFGGKGANQAVAASKCGAAVEMVAKVGDDLFGPATVSNFEHQGVGARSVRVTKGTATGAAAILVEPGGQNRIIVVKGANDQLLPADVERVESLIEYADLLILQFEIPLETVYRAVALAGACKVPVILNPAPALPFDTSQLRDVDYIVPNESEAELITGIRVGSLEDAKRAAQALHDLGFRRVVLTLGRRGALLSTKEGTEPIPAYSVDSKDTTGAGDAFIGSFAALLGRGMQVNHALRRASLYAALSTTEVGTQKSFPELHDLEAHPDY